VLDSTAVHFDRENSTLFDIDTNRVDVWIRRATPVIAASPLQTNASLGSLPGSRPMARDVHRRVQSHL
jgi:hypothetical protein